MTSAKSKTRGKRTHGVSISFDPAELAWTGALVEVLRNERLPAAGRSDVVRIALLELRDKLRGKTRAEIVRYFVQRRGDYLEALARRHSASTRPLDPVGPSSNK